MHEGRNNGGPPRLEQIDAGAVPYLRFHPVRDGGNLAPFPLDRCPFPHRGRAA
jgi:hypothetical protein